MGKFIKCYKQIKHFIVKPKPFYAAGHERGKKFHMNKMLGPQSLCWEYTQLHSVHSEVASPKVYTGIKRSNITIYLSTCFDNVKDTYYTLKHHNYTHNFFAKLLVCIVHKTRTFTLIATVNKRVDYL